MNNCFCELPDLDNPFTVDDILCEEDLELIHNYSSKSNLGANKVQWHDSTSDFYSGKELKQNSDMPIEMEEGMGEDSTVCNFRLIGDPINSQIRFADGDDALQQATEEIVTDYITKEVTGTSSKNIFSNIKPRSYTADGSLMTSSPNDYFCKPEVWEPHLTQVAVKEGFDNPFLLNLAKWHKVKIQDNTPRVTLRLMAEKDIPFSTWEKMVDNGTFLK